MVNQSEHVMLVVNLFYLTLRNDDTLKVSLLKFRVNFVLQSLTSLLTEQPSGSSMTHKPSISAFAWLLSLGLQLEMHLI